MRIARFIHPAAGTRPSGMLWGTVEGEAGAPPANLTVAAIDGHPFGAIAFTGERWALPEVRLVAPILPSKVVCIGKNYADHAREMGGEAPPSPVIFLKPSTAVTGPGDPIRLPPSDRVDHEAELAVVIGAPARDVPPEQAMRHVLGYTCGNDVTARDQQRADVQFTRGKGHDSFCPLGPWIETAIDASDVRVTARVNGDLRQDGRTSQMIHDVPALISFMSHVMTLLPGDVIMTGTPAGVGPIVAGDTVTVEIEGIGALSNPVVAK
ncbi:MAG: FAA hydrolase family protein [Jatrophihabitans sp.]|nr:MAG: FAA hydrolase family protein [Jatrophihabitans sp.]